VYWDNGDRGGKARTHRPREQQRGSAESDGGNAESCTSSYSLKTLRAGAREVTGGESQLGVKRLNGGMNMAFVIRGHKPSMASPLSLSGEGPGVRRKLPVEPDAEVSKLLVDCARGTIRRQMQYLSQPSPGGEGDLPSSSGAIRLLTPIEGVRDIRPLLPRFRAGRAINEPPSTERIGLRTEHEEPNAVGVSVETLRTRPHPWQKL